MFKLFWDKGSRQCWGLFSLFNASLVEIPSISPCHLFVVVRYHTRRANCVAVDYLALVSTNGGMYRRQSYIQSPIVSGCEKWAALKVTKNGASEGLGAAQKKYLAAWRRQESVRRRRRRDSTCLGWLSFVRKPSVTFEICSRKNPTSNQPNRWRLIYNVSLRFSLY